MLRRTIGHHRADKSRKSIVRRFYGARCSGNGRTHGIASVDEQAEGIRDSIIGNKSCADAVAGEDAGRGVAPGSGATLSRLQDEGSLKTALKWCGERIEFLYCQRSVAGVAEDDVEAAAAAAEYGVEIDR
jgi:hypothetical protein